MNCDECKEYILDYFMGEPTTEQANEAFPEHISECEGCYSFFQKQTRLNRTLKSPQGKQAFTEQLFERAKSLSQGEEYEAALECLDQARRIDPQNEKVLGMIAVVHFTKGTPPEEIPRDAADQMITVLKDKGDDHLIKKEVDEAIMCYRQALEFKPDDPQVLKKILINLGELYTYQDRFVEAMECLERADSLHPDHSLILYNIGRIHKIKKQYDEAVKYLKRASEIYPLDWEYWFWLGSTYLELKEYYKAEKALEESVKLHPDDWATLCNLGVAYVNNLKGDEAEIVLENAYSLNPEEPHVLNNLAVALDSKMVSDRALKLLNKAISVAPLDAPPFNNVALHYAQLGDDHQAIKNIERAYELDPENPVIQHNRDIILGRINRPLIPLYSYA